MTTIVYGIAGEGRGHAARAIALVDALPRRHRIVLFASGHAYDLLAPRYGDRRRENVVLHALPPVQFRYRGARVSYVRTGLASIPYFLELDSLVRRVVRILEQEAPSLILTDFEPVVPRAAARLGLPYVSLDHQHFLVASDLGELPRELRRYAAFMAPFVRAFYDGQAQTIVSSFFDAPLKRGYEHVSQVGVLLRPEVVHAEREHGSHLVAYVRRHGASSLMESLARTGREVRVYGLGAQEQVGRMRFLDIDARRFVEDLASSSALVTTAGNQLIGEALYLGKPVFGVPEQGNFEQRINAFFLQRSGTGIGLDRPDVDSEDLAGFLARIDELRERIDPERMNGTPAVVARINSLLETNTEIDECGNSSRIPSPFFESEGASRPIPAF